LPLSNEQKENSFVSFSNQLSKWQISPSATATPTPTPTPTPTAKPQP